MEHHLPAEFLTRKVKIAVVGAGGTGSQLMTGLARLHLALIALGHPFGIDVELFDDDIVTESNIGRQAFYASDIGNYKAPTIVNRINMGFGLNWSSSIERVSGNSRFSQFSMVIGCVDNRRARHAILEACTRGSTRYWLDTGNRLSDGQCILGEIDRGRGYKTDHIRLPHVADLYPEMIDASLDDTDELPSCGLADALEKQSLFINSAMTLWACNLLFELFRYGKISYHGNFINLKSGKTVPLMVDPEIWKRMGYEGSEIPEGQLAEDPEVLY